MIKCCHGFSAGKLFVASCLRELQTRGVHGLDFGFFGSGLRLRPTGSGVWFSFL